MVNGPQSSYSPKPSEEEWEKARESSRKWAEEQVVREQEDRLKRVQERLWREEYQKDLDNG